MEKIIKRRKKARVDKKMTALKRGTGREVSKEEKEESYSRL